jgi:hypothetical protein
MRNATHTTSGGTRTLKSLITRAPPFGPRLSASFQPGTRGFRFLGQRPRRVVLHLKPKPDQLAFWPIAAPPHRRIRSHRRLRHPEARLAGRQAGPVSCSPVRPAAAAACHAARLHGERPLHALRFMHSASCAPEISTIYRDGDRMRKARHLRYTPTPPRDHSRGRDQMRSGAGPRVDAVVRGTWRQIRPRHRCGLLRRSGPAHIRDRDRALRRSADELYLLIARRLLLVDDRRPPNSTDPAAAIELYPEDGKYDPDRHRKCRVRFAPCADLRT